MARETSLSIMTMDGTLAVAQNKVQAYKRTCSPYGDDSTNWVFPEGLAQGAPVERTSGGSEPGRGTWKSVTFTGTIKSVHAADSPDVATSVEVIKNESSETEVVTFSEFNVTVE